MNTISDILFVISNGLLIPVIVLLLYLACRAVWLLFSFYGEYRQRKKIAGILRHLVRNYSADELDKAEAELAECGEFCVTESIKNLLAHRRDRIYCELILSDFQVDVEKRLSRHRILVKFGPMLGLMGTLIPMGPALVGLAGGDIVSMAFNMQVAFATTVVGMAVAAVGLVTLQGDRRFYARSLNDLDFVFQKLMSHETQPDIER